MSGPTLRDAHAADLPAVAALHVACWRAAYRGILSDAILGAASVEQRLRLWRDWCTVPQTRLRVAEREGRLLGFCRLGPARDVDQPPPRFAEVTHLYVAPDAVGGGVGHRLFSEALAWARAESFAGLLLWVLDANERARRFYASHGLHCDGARHDEPDWLGPGVFEVRYRFSELSRPQFTARRGIGFTPFGS